MPDPTSAAWLTALRLDDPDAGGDVGAPPAGRAEFLRQVFDSEGAVSAERLGVVWREREFRLVRRAVERVRADIRRTTHLDPVVEVTDDEGMTVVSYGGDRQTPAVFSIREPETIRDVADHLRDHVVEDVWGVWPACPQHGSAMDPDVDAGRAVWRCRGTGHVSAEIGHLTPIPSPTTGPPPAP